ncbi:MAG: AhpC/TSA family protein [Cytophagales bacterium]|nr:AhpC/TSA family protein [Cytophagales bacterium]
MKINKIGLAIALAAGLFSCEKKASQKSNTIHISGKISHPSPSGFVVLERITDNQLIQIDTLSIGTDSTFSYDLSYDYPGFYRLNFYNTQMVDFIAEHYDLVIRTEGNNPNGTSTIEGSPAMDLLEEVNKTMEKFAKEIQEIRMEYAEANAMGDTKKVQKAEKKFIEIQNKIRGQVKLFIQKEEAGLAAFQLIGIFDPNQDYTFIEKTSKNLLKKYPNVPEVATFYEQVKRMRQVQVGAKAPEINLETPDGKMFALSSLKGKYVLIDFWASWCGPCRKENPHVVKLYKKYHSQGLEILGVSLDQKKKAWMKAINDDQLKWHHVSDLKGFTSEAAEKYQVQAIPATFLIDPEGVIIAKDLRGESLDKKLKEIFAKK